MKPHSNLFDRFNETFKSTINLTDHIDTSVADAAIRRNMDFRGPNAWILAFAIIIASVGLNVNSIPVVIGAMLISPLMGPIFGLGLGLGVNDIQLMKSSGKNLVIMVCISLVASFLYFLITPLNLTNPTELLARTNPTIYDVLIALFGGFAGIFEQCRKEKGTVFSGVAIATALMPPLCTAGFGLASGNFTWFLGAIYLFCINCIFIMLATYASVKYFKFKSTEFEDAASERKIKRLSSIIILLFIIPSVWSAVILVKQNNFEDKAVAFAEGTKAYGSSIVYDYKINHTHGSKIELFFTGDPLEDSTRENVYINAKKYGLLEESVLINDHSSTSRGNDVDFIKRIYEKMDEGISSRDAEIGRLKEKLKASRSMEIPYVQLTREIVNSYPGISDVHIAQGASVSTDSLHLQQSILVLVKMSEPLSPNDSSKLNDWLRIRMNNDAVTLLVVD